MERESQSGNQRRIVWLVGLIFRCEPTARYGKKTATVTSFAPDRAGLAAQRSTGSNDGAVNNDHRRISESFASQRGQMTYTNAGEDVR